MLTYKASYSA